MICIKSWWRYIRSWRRQRISPPDDEDLLKTILEDITSLLDRKQRTFEEDIDSLTEDLKRMTYRFEATHHDLAKSIRQVAVALGNMGI